MINQAIHTLDLIQLLAGAPLTSVKGVTGQALDYGIEVEDTAVGRFTFANGVTALFTGTVANYEDESVEISLRCDKAAFLLRDRTLYRLRGDDAEVVAADSGAFAGKQVYGNSHVALIEAFYQAVEAGEGWYIHPEEGLPSLRMIDGIRESSRTGQTVFF